MFIGRKVELERLKKLRKKKTASLIVCRGRRRIGKSRLIQEFGNTFPKFYQFSGLPPDKEVTT
ncbi:MAG: ATPase, partial [Candidatus Margulisbacteria bacterium]|nr:ATPase [Candidatus Margulisiibacteriota bacterium]